LLNKNRNLLGLRVKDDSAMASVQEFAERCAFPIVEDLESVDYVLDFTPDGVSLLDVRETKPIKLAVDFTAGASAHRMKFGGGKSQAIAKAVGLKNGIKPSVLDATAGLGGDAFVLATLGCRVQMLERSPVAYILLWDGLIRANKFVEASPSSENELLRRTLCRLQLQEGDALEAMKSFPRESFNVVFLDPMFPERSKSSRVKKEMQFFQQLIGGDTDADALLDEALDLAENRVVVKRPSNAPFLSQRSPSFQLKGKASRFDIYSKKKLA